MEHRKIFQSHTATHEGYREGAETLPYKTERGGTGAGIKLLTVSCLPLPEEAGDKVGGGVVI